MRKSVLAVALGCAVTMTAGNVLAQQSGTSATSEENNPVVAKVNGSEIHLLDLRLAMEELPPQYRSVPLQQIFAPLLQQMIQRRIVAQAAEKTSVTEDPEVQRRLAFARDEVLAQAYMGQRIDAAVTPEAVKARYEEELATAPRKEEVRARHILVESMEEADAIIGQLRGGAEFEALAKEHSTGPSGAKGGDLGFFEKEAMVPEFSEAAFALKSGEVSKPVKTQFGWHVIKLEERRMGEPASLEERAPELQQAMTQEAVQEILEMLQKSAAVEAFGPDGTPLDLEGGMKPAE